MFHVRRSTGGNLYRRFGEPGLEDRRAGPKRSGWNRIPDAVRAEILDMALDNPELSPRELAVKFTDERLYFVSEASVYRLLRARGLITSPAYIVMRAANEFKDKTLECRCFEHSHRCTQSASRRRRATRTTRPTSPI